MKKELIFAPALLLVGAALFLLKATGMTAHMIFSAVGVVLLIAYAILTRKTWKLPVLEILMRVFYGVALISGIVIMNIHGIAVLSITHKASAVLFAVLLVVLTAHKLMTKKQA